MRDLIFTNTKEVVPTLRSELELNGSEIMVSSGNSQGTERKCRELLGASFKILDWSDRDEMMQQNGLSRLFVKQDFLDRISDEPINPGKAIKLDKTGALAPYLRTAGQFHTYPDPGESAGVVTRMTTEPFLDYTYSERMWYQYDEIINALIDKPGTRQAYLSVWHPDIDVFNLERKRVPCSIGYHFLIREHKLHMIYIMRSLEVSKCLGNDIYTSSMLLEYIADKVGVENGSLQFTVGSLHIFE
jgi:thymidylate synthase